MKVLFVSSGNTETGISPIIKSQGESLIKEGVELDYFIIENKGIKGYFESIFSLKKYIKSAEYSLIHAHYGLSAIVAFFAKKRKVKLVVSFMGDDLVGSNDINGRVEPLSKLVVLLNKFFAKHFFHYNIVKSKEMLNVINLPNSEVISNGVDFDRFYEMDKIKAKEILDENINIKKVLFCSNPNRPEKNYRLAKKAINYLSDDNIKLACIHGIEQEKLVYHYNSADCLLLTSYHEGSPNVIKEAMACNIPIVSTDVGDVSEVIGKTDGCYVTSFTVENVANSIKKALNFNGKTRGREDIKHLESSSVAKKIIIIYRIILEN